jgi:hypothetical protein
MSCSLLFLGGDAWRTPPSSGGDTPGLDCFDLVCCKEFLKKCKPLSSNNRFLRTSIVRGLLQNVYSATINEMKYLPSSRPLPVLKKESRDAQDHIDF